MLSQCKQKADRSSFHFPTFVGDLFVFFKVHLLYTIQLGILPDTVTFLLSGKHKLVKLDLAN